MKHALYILLIAMMITFTNFIPAHAADDKLQIIEMTLKDHKFAPEHFTVPANKPFIIRLKNADKTPAEFESHDMKAEKIIGGGKTMSIRIRALKAGTYTFFDEFNEKTTRGTVTVK